MADLDRADIQTSIVDYDSPNQAFKIYFYRLLLFPNNLALIGTTDPERDEMFSKSHVSSTKDKGIL